MLHHYHCFVSALRRCFLVVMLACYWPLAIRYSLFALIEVLFIGVSLMQ